MFSMLELDGDKFQRNSYCWQKAISRTSGVCESVSQFMDKLFDYFEIYGWYLKASCFQLVIPFQDWMGLIH
uniref:Uncharacterized protein n=1 Tax=Rhizophora mucronata TaxID=61149 RepID=A0A2P2Q7F9_RHIMU